MVELAQKLVSLETETNSVKAELMAALSGTETAKPKVVKQRGPKKKTTQLAVAADGTAPAVEAEAPKRVSLKSIVQGILAKATNGLELSAIVAEVHAMTERKEYSTNAKSLSAVVSQAVTALKQENVIVHDRESKKYSLPTAA
jgi:hypothetical protein